MLIVTKEKQHNHIMRKPTEQQIEKYIRYPSELSDKEKKRIKKWIKQDQELQMLADWYNTFYQTIDQVNRDRKRFKDKPTIIILKPIEKSAYSNGCFILDAKAPASQETIKKTKLKTSQTFVSKEHKTLIRVLYDSSKSLSKLYIISDFVNEDDIVILDIGDEENNYLVSEPGGTFEIDEQEIPAEDITNWKTCEMHLPISKINVFRDNTTGDVNIDSFASDRQNEDIRIEQCEEVLQVSIDVSDKPMPNMLIVHSGKKTTMWPVERGQSTVPLESLNATKSDLFFFI